MEDLKINYKFLSGAYDIPYEKWTWVILYKKQKIL